MKAVILAGGVGSRISEESHLKPKPMIEIGSKPILWHIMKIYSEFGVDEFIICCGYKGHLIKEYFVNYFLHSSDLTIDLSTNTSTIHNTDAENWKVTIVDTGQTTMTGGRLKQVKEYLGDEDFFFTYGDGVGNVNIRDLYRFHKNHGRLATLTAARMPGRFGALSLEGNQVVDFKEKPKGDEGWINAGFFVLSPSVLDYIDGDSTVWEDAPLERLASEGNLKAFAHNGFWQPMDTLRDKTTLEKLWEGGSAPWKVWN